jgi:hypothetical protein
MDLAPAVAGRKRPAVKPRIFIENSNPFTIAIVYRSVAIA